MHSAQNRGDVPRESPRKTSRWSGITSGQGVALDIGNDPQRGNAVAGGFAILAP